LSYTGLSNNFILFHFARAATPKVITR